MGSQSTSKLPVIDFIKPELKPGTDEWDLMKGRVQQALEGFGCFEALFDKIPLEIRETIFGAMEELFDLPLEIKTLNVSKIPFHGYVGQRPKIPLYESIGLDDADVEAQTRTFWPQGNTGFSTILHKAIEGVRSNGRKNDIGSFQVEKYMDEHMDSTDYLVKVIKYKGPETSEKQVGVGDHTDMNMVTILYKNEVNGLRVQSRTGDWIDWKPSKDSFVVMIGESLHETLFSLIIYICKGWKIVDGSKEIVLVVNGSFLFT